MNTRNPWLTFVAVVVLALSILLAAYWLHDAAVTRAAMDNGYHQIVVDGELVWRKRPVEVVAKVVKWLVEIAVELF